MLKSSQVIVFLHFFSFSSIYHDYEDVIVQDAYIVDTLRDISKTLKEKFLVIGSQIQNKTQELKEAFGEHAQQIKKEIKLLGEQLKNSREALAKKLFELFNPAQYSEDNGNAFQALESLASLREKLQNFLNDVKSVTGEKWQKLKVIIQELRSEIKQKVRELLHGTENTAAYTALDADDETDDDAYVIDTLKDISKSLNEQFLVIGSQIQKKTQELKEAFGDHAQQIKEQIKALSDQLKKSRDALAKKLSELFNPARYADDNGNTNQILASLTNLRDKLQKFLREVHSATGEKWQKLKLLIQELRSEIKQKVRELLYSTKNLAVYAALDAIDDTTDDEYVIDTLKDISRSLKEQFLVIGSQIQNKTRELKEAVGDHAQQIREQLRALDDQLKTSRDALAKKLLELFSPARYADSNPGPNKVLASLGSLRDKLQSFLKEIQSSTAEKWETLKGRIRDLRSQIRQKIQEKIFGRPAETASSSSVGQSDDQQASPLAERALSLATRMFSLRWRLDVLLKELKDSGEDQWPRVLAKIDRLRKEISYQTAVYLNRTKSQSAYYEASDDSVQGEMYVVDTLKDVAQVLKQKFLVLGEKIKAKLAELRGAIGERAVLIKAQLQELQSQLQKAREELKAKLSELFKPAQYSPFKRYAPEIYEKLNGLREKLRKFLEDVKTLTGDNWARAKEVIAELRQEIKQKVKELLSAEKVSEEAMYQAEDNAPNSIVETLRETAVILKEKFKVLGKNIQEKVIELRGVVGEQAAAIRRQIESLKSQFNKAHSDLMAKLFAIFRPAQYSPDFGTSQGSYDFLQLRQKLQQLLCITATNPIEEWPPLEDAVDELHREMEAYLKKHE